MKPILFSGPMVRAILDGTKTQTRRVVAWRATSPADVSATRLPDEAQMLAPPASGVLGTWEERGQYSCSITHCPYGSPGDRLWVRETWAPVSPHEGEAAVEECRIEYRADVPAGHLPGGWHNAEPGDSDIIRWRPSTQMSRWASRITLEVTDVRLQRLQDITEEDARAEGCDPAAPHWPNPRDVPERDEDPGVVGYPPAGASFAIDNFRRLWDSAYGKRRGCSWADNPWVFAVSFRRVDA